MYMIFMVKSSICEHLKFISNICDFFHLCVRYQFYLIYGYRWYYEMNLEWHIRETTKLYSVLLEGQKSLFHGHLAVP
jgi:hypothetical protein